MSEGVGVGVGIELELAPAVNVTAGMRPTIKEAFATAGLTAVFVPGPGDTSLEHPERRWAEPTLHVVLKPMGKRSDVDVLDALGGPLGLALRRVREDLPQLPLSVVVIHEGGERHWFGFRRQTSPDAIVLGLGSTEGIDGSKAAFGWGESELRWLKL